jgi:formamidopyrimidine-DNA glycosylase
MVNIGSVAVPELLEVEIYRTTAVKSIGRRIVAVEVLDPFGLRHGSGSAEAVEAALVGSMVVAARRRGKLLLLDLAGSPRASVAATLGVRFGMTGRLLVDESAGIDGLLYSSDRNEAAWDRFRVRFADGGSMAVRDPRRLGGVELDPDEAVLGPDATELTRSQLAAVLKGSTAPVKARLLDQHRIAGIGNLLADEILWRAGISPKASSDRLSPARVARLHDAIVTTLVELGARGGSHLGDVMEARRPGGLCPRDGSAMKSAQVGGRTTYWCPTHQREEPSDRG